MNDRDENFLARWSRVKRQAGREQGKPNDAPTETPAAGTEPARSEGSDSFDASTLPPVDSITAATDIRDFLRAGVPAELTKAALRQVWTSDPAIRDFIGIAENQWDFTDPNAIPGFGPMAPTDDVADLVARAMGKLDDVEGGAATEVAFSESQPAQFEAPITAEPAEASSSDAIPEEQESAAAQQSPDMPRPARRHGGALPT